MRRFESLQLLRSPSVQQRSSARDQVHPPPAVVRSRLRPGRPIRSGRSSPPARRRTLASSCRRSPWTGKKVVAAYLTSDTEAEAATFTPSSTRDAVGLVRHRIAAGQFAIGNPLLLPRAEGGLQVLIDGIPTFGVSFVPRNADGSFGAPVTSTDNISATGVGPGPAVLAPDGAPVWGAARGGVLWLWRGAAGATGVDLSSAGSLARGREGFPALGRDSSGRTWLAWVLVGTSIGGHYLVQIDPVSLRLVGTPQRAPGSGLLSLHIGLACAKTCRLVYAQSAGARARIVSWAFGEKAATQVAKINGSALIAYPTAAYTPKGRLWVAWWNRATKRYEATRGSAVGGGGSVVALGSPLKGGEPGAVSSIASGENLVLVTNWLRGGKASSRFVNVVPPS